MMARAATARLSSVAGTLLLTLVAALLLHSALYHSGHPGSGSILSAAVPADPASPWPARHHLSLPEAYSETLFEDISVRCPAPDLIPWPVMLFGLAAQVVVGVTLIAAPVIRHTRWVGVPQRPPRVVLQRFLL